MFKDLPKEVISGLPLAGPFDGEPFESCALVSSSRDMLKKKQGALIDSYAAVMRINGAPTKGFEAYVGKRQGLTLSTFRRNVTTTQIRPLYQVLLGFPGELNSCHADVRLVTEQPIAPRWRWTALPAVTRPRRLRLLPRRTLR